jgi:sugar lactone lactonase YvrE
MALAKKQGVVHPFDRNSTSPHADGRSILMTPIHDFKGKILSSAPCELGEGPSFDAETNTLWWFSIIEKQLHELDLNSGTETVHDLPVMASVIAEIDSARQLLASDQGIFIRDRATGDLTHHCHIEADKPGNRSNDGRLHPSGALWIGTMGRRAETGAGSIYHVAGKTVTKLFDAISIPNAICFSPDGAFGYYVDTKVNHLMRVALDPATGLPTGKPSLFVDGSGKPGGMDGAICGGDGTVWNARWGEGAVDHYATDGSLIGRYLFPATQTSCPVVLGDGRLAVTTAWEGMSDEQRAEDKLAGALFEIEAPVKMTATPRFRL